MVHTFFFCHIGNWNSRTPTHALMSLISWPTFGGLHTHTYRSKDTHTTCWALHHSVYHSVNFGFLPCEDSFGSYGCFSLRQLLHWSVSVGICFPLYFRFVASARQLAKALEVPLVNDLGYTKRYVRCLQVVSSILWLSIWIIHCH